MPPWWAWCYYCCLAQRIPAHRGVDDDRIRHRLGLYCITGKRVQNAAAATAGNFILAVPIALVVFLLSGMQTHMDASGLMLAVTSGALASGAAYLLWYSLLPMLSPATASTLQLSVPCLAALGGMVFLGEALTARMLISIAVTLSGIGLVIYADRSRNTKE
ncbi:DMT family transporter [Pseudocitrobacter faecalis]